jgi:hypothetical protein
MLCLDLTDITFSRGTVEVLLAASHVIICMYVTTCMSLSNIDGVDAPQNTQWLLCLQANFYPIRQASHCGTLALRGFFG